jgi:DNA adenine methylase
MGGKFRQAPHIAKAIAAHSQGYDRYHEPFLGGGNSAVAATRYFCTVTAADLHEDLVLLWQAVLSGWQPPDSISEAQYAEIKAARPSALRGFVGFGCSFGGKFFGGYARQKKDAKHTGDICGAAKKGLLKKAAILRQSGVVVTRQNFLDYMPPSPTVVYCDPPYEGTTSYTSMVDSAQFWRHCEFLALVGHRVFVSEYSVPDYIRAKVIWERQAALSLMRSSNTGKAVERLYLVQ